MCGLKHMLPLLLLLLSLQHSCNVASSQSTASYEQQHNLHDQICQRLNHLERLINNWNNVFKSEDKSRERVLGSQESSTLTGGAGTCEKIQGYLLNHSQIMQIIPQQLNAIGSLFQEQMKQSANNSQELQMITEQKNVITSQISSNSVTLQHMISNQQSVIVSQLQHQQSLLVNTSHSAEQTGHILQEYLQGQERQLLEIQGKLGKFAGYLDKWEKIERNLSNHSVALQHLINHQLNIVISHILNHSETFQHMIINQKNIMVSQISSQSMALQHVINSQQEIITSQLLNNSVAFQHMITNQQNTAASQLSNHSVVLQHMISNQQSVIVSQLQHQQSLLVNTSHSAEQTGQIIQQRLEGQEHQLVEIQGKLGQFAGSLDKCKKIERNLSNHFEALQHLINHQLNIVISHILNHSETFQHMIINHQNIMVSQISNQSLALQQMISNQQSGIVSQLQHQLSLSLNTSHSVQQTSQILQQRLQRQENQLVEIQGKLGQLAGSLDKCGKIERNLSNHSVALQQLITQQLNIMASQNQQYQTLLVNTSLSVQQFEQRFRELENRLVRIQETLEGMTERCPDGFQYFPGLNYCYKVVPMQLNWTQARDQCSEINRRSQLAVVTNQAQHDAINVYLKTFHSSGITSFYTSGQRLIDGNCNTIFFWKPTPATYIPLSYTNWFSLQPDCWNPHNGHLPESCLQYATRDNGLSYKWNDMPCSSTAYPLCEYAL